MYEPRGRSGIRVVFSFIVQLLTKIRYMRGQLRSSQAIGSSWSPPLHSTFLGVPPFQSFAPKNWDFSCLTLLTSVTMFCIWAKWQEDSAVLPHPPEFTNPLIREEGSSSKFWVLLLLCSLCHHCCCQDIAWDLGNIVQKQGEEKQTHTLSLSHSSAPVPTCGLQTVAQRPRGS